MEAERKAAWYAANKKKPRQKLSDEQKKARRREYDRKRRERLANDPAWQEAERKRKRESYHRNKPQS